MPPSPFGGWSTLGGLPATSRRKEGATAGQYAPKPPGYTRAAMAGTTGSDPERGRQSLKPRLSRNRGLQLALVNLESLVTACHQRAVNTSLLLAHTARRSTQGGRSRNKVAVGEPAAGSPPLDPVGGGLSLPARTPSYYANHVWMQSRSLGLPDEGRERSRRRPGVTVSAAREEERRLCP